MKLLIKKILVLNLDFELSRLSPAEVLISREISNDPSLQKLLQRYHLTVIDSIPSRDVSIETMQKSNFESAVVDLNEVI